MVVSETDSEQYLFKLYFAAPADPCALRPCRNRETCVSAQNNLGYICRPPPSEYYASNYFCEIKFVELYLL